MKKTLQGTKQTIEYADALISTTTITFTFWDRVKIMFGRTCWVTTTTYMKEVVSGVLGTEEQVIIARLIPSRKKGGFGEPEMVMSKPPTPSNGEGQQ